MSQSPLLSPLTFKSGITIPQRTAMAPMVAQGADPNNGLATKADIDYFAKRSKVAGMIITGAAYVSHTGQGFAQQLSIADDAAVPGLAKIAEAIKADGAKAYIQLYHGGREAAPVAAAGGRVLVPSKMEFPWLDYEVNEITADEIAEVIAAFGAATKRAIAAGFDGVEIHGANHYLLQQFFSTYSNHRTDKWGGDLTGRMAFPLAVTDAVMAAAADADRPFSVGYRICVSEVHGENVGYDFKESAKLIDAVVERGVDYIHLSEFTGFDIIEPTTGKPVGVAVKDLVAERCPVIIVSNVFTEADAEAAAQHGDIVAIGRAALIDPEFTAKIAAGKGTEIATTVAGRLAELAWPQGLIDWYLGSGKAILPPVAGMDTYEK